MVFIAALPPQAILGFNQMFKLKNNGMKIHYFLAWIPVNLLKTGEKMLLDKLVAHLLIY